MSSCRKRAKRWRDGAQKPIDFPRLLRLLDGLALAEGSKGHYQ